MNTPELKPCPFCGAHALVYALGPHEHIIVDLPKFGGGYVVECPLCDAGFAGETLEDVVYQWNKRWKDDT